MLAKTNRLTRKKDFETVFQRGQSFKEDFLVLRFVSNKMKNSRLGVVISKKISKKATARNKIKRRIREIVKLIVPKIKKRTDIVLLALPGLETKDFWEMEETVKKLFKKAKLINDDQKNNYSTD